jgi:hypothetical protein
MVSTVDIALYLVTTCLQIGENMRFVTICSHGKLRLAVIEWKQAVIVVEASVIK